MTPTALLFDLDGTLTDPFEGITRCIVHALESLGRTAPARDDLRWCIGPPLRESFARLLATEEQRLIERAVELYRERFSTVGLYENALYSGIPQVLDHFARVGRRLFIATTKPTVYATRIIDHFGLGDRFEAIYGAGLDGSRGEKVEIISDILRDGSIAAGEAVMIGDRKHDMIGATACAVRGVGVLWGYGSRDELTASGAASCVATPDELVRAIG